MIGRQEPPPYSADRKEIPMLYFSLAAIVIAAPPPSSARIFAEMLDLDQDGVVHPMEAADALSMILEGSGEEGLSVEDADLVIEEYQQFQREDAEFLIEDFDTDGDGVLRLAELPEDLADLAAYCDLDKDGSLTVDEIITMHPDSDAVLVAAEVDEIFLDLDDDGDGLIPFSVLQEDDVEFAELVAPFDTNGDKQIARDELLAGFAILDAPVSFDIDGSRAMMSGTIGPSTPFRVMELILHNPEVNTIVIVDVPGSVDDDSSLRAARMIRSHGFRTHLPSHGMVSSGGTDFFQAGMERTCDRGAQFGIHSWSAFGMEGADLPRDDEEHEMDLDYCDEMGIPRSFYWRSLHAASSDDMHWMTEEELIKYKMLTAPIRD